MGESLCLLKNAALVVISEPSDQIILLAFLIASVFRLRGHPIVFHVLLCNIFWVLTAAYTPETYWLLCFVSSSYVFEYYYRIKSAAAIPALLLSTITLIMGLGIIFELVGWYAIYNALFNSYEILISIVYAIILLCLVDWRRVLSYMGSVINNVRIGQSGFNRLFSLL